MNTEKAASTLQDEKEEEKKTSDSIMEDDEKLGKSCILSMSNSMLTCAFEKKKFEVSDCLMFRTMEYCCLKLVLNAK